MRSFDIQSRGEEVDLAIRGVAHAGDPFEARVPQLYDAFREQTR